VTDAEGLRQQGIDDQEYVEVTDQSSHHYYIPLTRYAEWSAWSELDEEDERSWNVPDYAVPIDGGHLIFKSPRIGHLD
jgi:hypothetical protein